MALPTLVILLLGAVPPADPAATATQDESPSREVILRRLRAIAGDLEGASEFRDAVRQSARILARTEVQYQTLFLAPADDAQVAFHDNLVTIQKNTSLVQFKLQSLLDDLAVVSAARAKEERRWRAYHDYVRARIRIDIDTAYSYNAMLGQMRKELLPADKELLGWRLVLSPETRADLDRLGFRDQARADLRRLVAENPGGDWEHIARQELEPFGLRWKWEPISRR